MGTEICRLVDIAMLLDPLPFKKRLFFSREVGKVYIISTPQEIRLHQECGKQEGVKGSSFKTFLKSLPKYFTVSEVTLHPFFEKLSMCNRAAYIFEN